jgi:hypothetical protein
MEPALKGGNTAQILFHKQSRVRKITPFGILSTTGYDAVMHNGILTLNGTSLQLLFLMGKGERMTVTGIELAMGLNPEM